MNESRRAVAHVPGVRMHCTGCGAVRGGKHLFLYPVVVVLWLGRCGGLTRKDGSLPSLRGGPHEVARTGQLDRPPGHPCRESPGLFVLSLSHFLGVQQTVGRQSTPRDSVDRAAVSHFQPPRARLHALLNASAASESTAAGGLEAASSNASAASESTTAGGLEAFSQGTTGAKRFENASSKFRWNPSPPRPSTIAPVRGERPDVGHSSP